MASLETVATFCFVSFQLQKYIQIKLRVVPETWFRVDFVNVRNLYDWLNIANCFSILIMGVYFWNK